MDINFKLPSIPKVPQEDAEPPPPSFFNLPRGNALQQPVTQTFAPKPAAQKDENDDEEEEDDDDDEEDDDEELEHKREQMEPDKSQGVDRTQKPKEQDRAASSKTGAGVTASTPPTKTTDIKAATEPKVNLDASDAQPISRYPSIFERLGDFFTSMTRKKKKFVVEDHKSESTTVEEEELVVEEALDSMPTSTKSFKEIQWDLSESSHNTPSDATLSEPLQMEVEESTRHLTREPEKNPYRHRLIRFFKTYDRSKLPLLETYLTHFHSRWDYLFRCLTDMYGPEPPPESYFERLVRFYGKYDPRNVGNARRHLQSFSGKEEDLFGVLTVQYGLEPDPPTPANARGGFHSLARTIQTPPMQRGPNSPNHIFGEIRFSGISNVAFDFAALQQQDRFRDALRDNLSANLFRIVRPSDIKIQRIGPPCVTVRFQITKDWYLFREAIANCLIPRVRKRKYDVEKVRRSYTIDLDGDSSFLFADAACIFGVHSTPNYGPRGTDSSSMSRCTDTSFERYEHDNNSEAGIFTSWPPDMKYEYIVKRDATPLAYLASVSPRNLVIYPHEIPSHPLGMVKTEKELMSIL